MDGLRWMSKLGVVKYSALIAIDNKFTLLALDHYVMHLMWILQTNQAAGQI